MNLPRDRDREVKFLENSREILENQEIETFQNGKTMIFFGVKTVVPSSTLKMRKSHKKLARVYAYTHAYTQIRYGGGKSAPPRDE